jgi:hypothetical protein
MALSAVCGSMAYSVVESTTVLANLASGRRRGRSCACPGAALRVVASESSFDRRPYANSRAWLTEDRRLHSGGRGGVLTTWVPTMLGMALQCLGWRHSGGDGRTGPEVTGKTRPVDLMSRRRPRQGGVGGCTPFEGAAVLFRGGDVEEVREWATQCHGMTPAFPHSSRTASGI